MVENPYSVINLNQPTKLSTSMVSGNSFYERAAPGKSGDLKAMGPRLLMIPINQSLFNVVASSGPPSNFIYERTFNFQGPNFEIDVGP